MVLRKITIDNSVKYVPQSKQTQERDIKQNKMKYKSLHHKQNRKLSRNSKKFIAGGFGLIK